MQVTLFKGLLPVDFPDSWVSDPERVRFGRLHDRKQVIDFRANGGPALAFWVDSDPGSSLVHQRYEKLPDHIVGAEVDWTADAFAVSSRREVVMFGQSGAVLDLAYLGA